MAVETYPTHAQNHAIEEIFSMHMDGTSRKKSGSKRTLMKIKVAHIYLNKCNLNKNLAKDRL